MNKIKNYCSLSRKGSVTIYLSIVMVGVMLFVSVISESARIKIVYSESKSFTYMAADSVLAGYAKQIYDEYGVLLVWEKEAVKEELKKYIQANINMADLSGVGTNFMSTKLNDIEMKEVGYVTDREGELFVSQIVSYMKYAGVTQAVNQLINLFTKYKKSNDVEKNTVTFMFDSKKINVKNTELQELVNKINKKTLKIKNVKKQKELTEAVSQILEDKKDSNYDKKFIKKYRKLRTQIDKEAILVNSVIILGENYERKKAVYLKESGYTSGERDYIGDNLITLKKIRDKIKDEKALGISELSEINPLNIEYVRKAIKILNQIISYIESLKENHVTKEDTENKSIYESARDLLDKGILSLVIDDVSDVSNVSVSDLNLPSMIKKQKTIKSPIEKVREKAFMSMYINRKFGNYNEPKENHNLQYELEYIINGDSNDKRNLTAVLEKIVGIRNAMNVAYLVTDKVKMKELSFIAASAATALGLPFLEPILKVVLIEAWSMAEAISDVKQLLKGKSVAFIKNKNNWNTDIKNLLGNRVKEDNTKKMKLNYEQYCLILIMLMDNHKCIFRTMDLIQLNIKKQYNHEFDMCHCFQNIKFNALYETKPLFTAMPWVINLLNNNNGAYQYAIMCEMKY